MQTHNCPRNILNLIYIVSLYDTQYQTPHKSRIYNECMKMADIYRSRGYDVEADMVEKRAKELKDKIKK